MRTQGTFLTKSLVTLLAILVGIGVGITEAHAEQLYNQ